MRYGIAGAVLAVIIVALPAHSQPYPSKTIRLIVPNAPGGGTDTVARLVCGEKSVRRWGSRSSPTNRGGAGGAIAAEMVARAPKDGHTLLLGSAATLITGPALIADRKYDPVRDFAPVSLIGTTAYMLVTHPSAAGCDGARVDQSGEGKRRPHHVCIHGQGSPAHLGAELFQAMAKVKMVHVPYKGGAPAMLSLLQGETFVMISNFLTALPQVREKRIRGLGVTSLTRSTLAADIPTIGERVCAALNWSVLLHRRACRHAC
jgi:tripartite-type tricarboxylate transporter receptor subunit TctC